MHVNNNTEFRQDNKDWVINMFGSSIYIRIVYVHWLLSCSNSWICLVRCSGYITGKIRVPWGTKTIFCSRRDSGKCICWFIDYIYIIPVDKITNDFQSITANAVLSTRFANHAPPPPPLRSVGTHLDKMILVIKEC